ncbi:MAG: Crp/Fnr family transcriptional regulator [Eubacteriales bacterium]|nr:Crp/Fnr family transcriptional regulator [Eubacteriales bacterium]
MKSYLKEIKQHPLFAGINPEDLSAMLDCLGYYTRSYKKGEIIILSEETVKCVGIILRGKVHMVKENDDGTQTLLVHMHQGELFGETFACGSNRSSRVTFWAASSSHVLFLPFYKILHICTNACIFHHRLVENMVRLLCDKNVQLMEKVEVSSRRTLRDKIITYLRLQAERQRTTTFTIPLGRTELAEYLCADRSSLSRELKKMEEDGLISYHKNHFILGEKSS